MLEDNRSLFIEASLFLIYLNIYSVFDAVCDNRVHQLEQHRKSFLRGNKLRNHTSAFRFSVRDALNATQKTD